MTEPVKSVFTLFFKVKCIIVTLVTLFGIIDFVIACSDQSDALQPKIPFLPLLAIGICWFFYAMLSLRTITAAPEGIILNYLLTKKQIVINYADIEHVSNVLPDSNRLKPTLSSLNGLKLLIELKSGKSISFFQNDIKNYDELKEAIREFRLHLV